MKKKFVILGLVAVMLLGVTYAYSQGPGFGPGHRHGEGRCHEVWSSLTPEQKTMFQELRRKFNEETAQLRDSMFTKRLELQSLWVNPEAAEKAIMDKEKELRDLHNQWKDKMIQKRLDVRKLLTPEQIKTFGPGCGIGSGFGRGPVKGYGVGRGVGRDMRPGMGTNS